MVRAYWGTILSVDDSVGRLVEILRSRGELDNTMIVFMGDNGLLEGEQGMVDKRTMHEPSIRIPLVIRYPGLTPTGSRRVTEQVLTVDIAPTIVEATDGAPMETNNLIDDPRQAKRVQQLKDQLTQLMQDAGIEQDTMPLDQGIKTKLPEQSIR